MRRGVFASLSIAGALWATVPRLTVAQSKSKAAPAIDGLDAGGSAMKAFDFEDAQKYDSAAVWFRATIAKGDIASGILGLERVWAAQAKPEAMVALADTLLRGRPTDPVLHSVKVRTLVGMSRTTDAAAAFDAWAAIAPRDAEPWREYARALMQRGRIAAADSVVTRAQRVLGDTRAVAVEVAQIRGALGQWETSALAWREAMMGHDGVDDAAVYGLKLAPLARRDGVINALTMPPVLPMSRQVAASLLLEWGRARDAWAQLSPLPRSAASVAVWRRFADEAQRRDAPLAARDALVSVLESGITAELALQAAELSLQGGDAAVALDLTEVALRGADAASVSARRAVLRVRALTVLGRMDEAEREAAAMTMDPSGRRSVAAALARGWALRGDIGRARQTLRAADVHADEDPAAAWIALWSGDLATARSGFRASGERSASASSVLALLSRTKTDSSANVGAAYLALARGDTAKAVTSFVLAARSVADAAPFLQLAAARLAANRRDDATSVVQWRTILEESPTAPEAAEADLEWARQLRRTGQVTQAKTRLEHLILTYPQSALVPQARRELERAEGRVP